MHSICMIESLRSLHKWLETLKFNRISWNKEEKQPRNEKQCIKWWTLLQMCVPITINTRVCEHISNGKLPGVLCTADLFCIGNLKSSSAIYLPVFNHFKICRLQHWQTRTILCPALISGCWKRPKSGEKNNHSGSGVGLCASPSWGAHPTAQLQEEMGKVAHQPATAPKEKI